MNIGMPKEVIKIIDILYSHGFEAFAVGGCVRDSLLKKTPYDWDICTDCKPDNLMKIFEKKGIRTIPTGLKHGTISLVINDSVYEITTYRIDGEYINNRQPETIEFTSDLLEDLSRRDFTINSIAYNHIKGVVDPFNGREDLTNSIIRAVGNPDERFKEDALRIIRGIRFATVLEFNFDKATKEGIKKNSELLANISKERINAELNKILISSKPSMAFFWFRDMALFDYIIPELKDCINLDQKNPHHDKDVFNHTMATLDNAENDLVLRLAALFHDIGKPSTFSQDEEGVGHFYNHHIVGAAIAEEALKKLKYDNNTIKEVTILVKEHMSRYDDVTDKAVKRLINRVGKDNLHRLFKLQRADIKASAQPYDYDKIDYLEEKCNDFINTEQPLSVKDLDINGHDLIEMGIDPGKQIGVILDLLLEKVLEEPELNTKEKLLSIVKEKFCI